MVFLVVMYGCENWTKKKAECQRTDAFELWCWRRLWTARRSNQSILKEMHPGLFIVRIDDEAEVSILWPTNGRADLLGKKTLMLGKIEGRRRGQQRMRWLDSITNSMDMSFSKFQEMVKDEEAWHAAVHAISTSQTQLSLSNNKPK